MATRAWGTWCRQKYVWTNTLPTDGPDGCCTSNTASVQRALMIYSGETADKTPPVAGTVSFRQLRADYASIAFAGQAGLAAAIAGLRLPGGPLREAQGRPRCRS